MYWVRLTALANGQSGTPVLHLLRFWGLDIELDSMLITGQARLIRTPLIRSSTLFEVSVKCFAIILQSFHV